MTAAARPAKSARHAAKLRAMRKVKGAIRWHERAREQRQKITQERYDEKQARKQAKAWEKNLTQPIREIKKNLREDYELGPLRPNRAVGPGVDQYGVMGMSDMARSRIPADVWARTNEARIKKGLAPEYPLVVDDKKYFPLAVGDRVMVVKGRELGKIGIIEELAEETHQVTVAGINKVCASNFSSTANSI